MSDDNIGVEELKQAILNMSVEAWRFRKTFEKAMSKMEPEESLKTISKFNWFMKKMNDALNSAGMRYVNLEGQEFSEGLPVSPINIDDFEPNDKLLIEQMLEPIIMEGDAVKKPGTAILGRIEE